MRPEVEQAAQHGEGLLHAEEAAEGPLPVELHYGFRRQGGGAQVGHEVLARVVALLRAGPEEEAAVRRDRGAVGGVGAAVLAGAGLGEGELAEGIRESGRGGGHLRIPGIPGDGRRRRHGRVR